MKMVYLKKASTLRTDAGKCTGCALCAEVRSRGVLALETGEACIKDERLLIGREGKGLFFWSRDLMKGRI